ncbi:hypothetical protein [Pseudomonas reactans]|uniref:hypothetical protein n=1 Tax=Pseudomonas reactans TaxID=117680 RepID=UPI00159FA20A|nr:hypothetical protein [Pseudomonas reactans]NWC90504.1 hypothetical protein [Pseudomonas reactans]
MRQSDQFPSSFSAIMEGKSARRDVLMSAVASAQPGDLVASAERIKEVMRKPSGSNQRRQRIAPPAFLAMPE